MATSHARQARDITDLFDEISLEQARVKALLRVLVQKSPDTPENDWTEKEEERASVAEVAMIAIEKLDAIVQRAERMSDLSAARAARILAGVER